MLSLLNWVHDVCYLYLHSHLYFSHNNNNNILLLLLLCLPVFLRSSIRTWLSLFSVCTFFLKWGGWCQTGVSFKVFNKSKIKTQHDKNLANVYNLCSFYSCHSHQAIHDKSGCSSYSPFFPFFVFFVFFSFSFANNDHSWARIHIHLFAFPPPFPLVHSLCFFLETLSPSSPPSPFFQAWFICQNDTLLSFTHLFSFLPGYFVLNSVHLQSVAVQINEEKDETKKKISFAQCLRYPIAPWYHSQKWNWDNEGGGKTCVGGKKKEVAKQKSKTKQLRSSKWRGGDL